MSKFGLGAGVTIHTVLRSKTLRGAEWDIFAHKVNEHVESYAVPQYGDKGVDLATEYTHEKCLEEIKKYASRGKTGMRGSQESLRDLLKIAHYAQLAYAALENLHCKYAEVPD